MDSFSAGNEGTSWLMLSIFFPPVHPTSKLAEEWCKEVEKRIEGRVKISHNAPQKRVA
jgi:TRAP-type C4-dicarboxylate transport system substrate-binding protein